ncbi:MAG: HEAT repeat domain-containing protein [Chloroflexota bacterium]
MTQTAPFLQVTRALLDESKPFPARYLHRFSDLEPADLKSVLEAWPQVSLRRKLALLEDLEELAETDTLMSFEVLAPPLLTDPEPGVRAGAIRLLWECDDPKLVPTYLHILNADESAQTRSAAATALGLFIYEGELEEISSDILHQVEENLLKAARKAKTTLVRRRALEALGASSRQEVPALIEAAYHRKESEWIVSALFAMGRSSDNRWEKNVLSKLHHPNDDIRTEAIRAAGELSMASARLPLLDLLADEEDPEMRREIIWALSKIGGEGVRSTLEELLEAESDDEETDFLEEALENLLFTEDLNQFDLLDYELDDEEGEK